MADGIERQRHDGDDGGGAVRALVVAGYASVRAGLHALLADAPGVRVVGAVEGVGESLARLLPGVRPNVVLLDTTGDSPAVDNVGAYLDLWRGDEADAPAFVVLADCPERDLPRLLAAGMPGWGYLLREADTPQIVGAVRAAAEGLVVLDRSLRLPAPPPATPTPALPAPRPLLADVPGENLTPREVEVLQLMAQGLPNKQIAAKLRISLHTAKFHVAQILGKLGATSRTEAVTLGARRGYVVL